MICNLGVVGSNPSIGSKRPEAVSKTYREDRIAAIAADCKSAPSGSVVRVHLLPHNRGSSSVGRASAFQAEGREFEPRFPLKSKPV